MSEAHIDRPMMTRPVFLLTVILGLVVYCQKSIFAEEGLDLRGVALTPNSRLVAGQTLVLVAKLENPGKQRAEGRVIVTAAELPNLRCVRNVVVEAGKSEQFELTIPVPHDPSQIEQLSLTATVYVREGSREVILERNGAPVVSTLQLFRNEGRIFGMALEPEVPPQPEWYWPRSPTSLSYEFAIAARVDADSTKIAASYETQSLPLSQVHWNSFDIFVIADPAPLKDPAAVQALQEFLERGGRVLIMLDKVHTSLVRPLLGLGQSCEEVDRIELNDLTIEVEADANKLSKENRSISSDVGITMARILQTGGRVTHHAEGWPIAMSMDIGYGQLCLTTLDSSVWIRPREKQKSNLPYQQCNYETRLWAENFAISSFVPRSDLPLTKPTDYPLKLVGNPVVPKSWVAAALLGFCGLLTCTGVFFAYVGRMTLLGVVAPCIAILASIALMISANWVRRDIPESVSRLQLVDIGGNGKFASIREQASVYLATAADMQCDSKFDGIMRTANGAGSLVIKDFQDWHVADSNWPPGAWRYDMEYVIPTEELIVKGRLSSDGLELILPDALPSSLQDPILSYVTGDPLLCEVIEAGLRANTQHTVDQDRWITGAIISDEQQRRSEIYRQFFEPNKLLRRPGSRLYGWTNTWPGSNWSRKLKEQGSALVSLPVVLVRPTNGEEVFVPHGLVQVQRRFSTSNLTSAFDDVTGKWRDEVAMASDVDVDFVLPEVLVPIELKSIEFAIDITAPQRTVTVNAITDSGSVQIIKLDSPSIPWKQTITDPAILKAFQLGRLPVSISVSKLSSEGGGFGTTSNVTWNIKYFHVGVRGQILPKLNLSQSP